MLPFYALLVFANLSTVVAAYPSPGNTSFNADTQWTGLARRLYPIATWAGLASTIVMLAAWLIYILAPPLRHIAAIAWAAGLFLSAPTLAYRMLFIRTLIPWEKR
jgi:hypothetical protein